MTTNRRYEVTTEEDPETGDMIIPLPPELLTELGWVEGDSVEFLADADTGQYILRKTG